MDTSRIGTASVAALMAAVLTASPSDAAWSAQGDGSSWSWRSVRIDGMGFVTGLAIQPRAPYHVYIKTDVGGVYRFDRQAAAWRPMMDTFPRSEERAFDVEALAVVPGAADGLAILAPRSHPTDVDPFGGSDAYGEVWRTIDGGVTWAPLGLLDQRIRVAGNGEYRGFTGERLAIDPRQPERMLVASRIEGGWLREVNGAWSRVVGLPNVTPWVDPNDPTNLSYGWNTPGHTFALFDPRSSVLADGSTALVYVGDHETGVYRSTDGGRTFVLLPGSPRYAARASVAVDGRLYVNTVRQAVGPHAGQPELGGLYRFDPSPGGGAGAWVDITPTVPWSSTVRDVRPYAGIAVHPRSPGVLLASVSGGHDKFWSRDRGATWTRTSALPIAGQPPYFPPPTPQNYDTHAGDWGNAVVVFDPASPRSAWTQNGFGVIRCANAASPSSTWRWEMQNLEELVMHSVLVPPVPFAQGGAALLSSCMDMMGFRHVDVDVPPTERIGEPLFIGQASGLAYSALVPEHASFVGWDTWAPWVSLTGRSSDNGRTWVPFADSTPGRGGRIVMSATNPQNLLWEPSQWAPPVVSFDGGTSWQRLVDLDATVDPNDPNSQLVGPAWHVSNGWWQGAHLAADRVDGQRFYRFTWGQWSSSTDGGATWRRGFSSWALGPQAPEAFTINTRLVPHPTRAGEVWISAVPNGGREMGPVFRTTDGGATVAPVPGFARATQVAFGLGSTPAVPAIYVLGEPTTGGALGVYRSLDDGASWSLVSDPAQHSFQRAAAMDADMRVTGRVYVAMSGRGVIVGSEP